jgi:hypothetical protein
LFLRAPRRRALLAAAAFASTVLTVPDAAFAEGLFDMFFGGSKPQARPAAPQASFFADPNSNTPQMPPPAAAPRVAGSGPAFCVRSCDGKYFPVTARGNATPAQMCQAFCPASLTKVYFGSNIDYASTTNGERYAASENAFVYRKELRPDCTCNGRNAGGLVPIDISLDGSLRPGDVLATSSGLVAYTGIRVGNDQAADFTPVASFPGLTAEVRARLGEIKVAPVSAEITGEGPMPEVRELSTTASVPKTPAQPTPAQPKAKRAALN